MKRGYLLFAICVLLMSIASCNNKMDNNTDSSQESIVTVENTASEATTEAAPSTISYQALGLNFELPDDWKLTETTDDYLHYENEEQDLGLSITYMSTNKYSTISDDTYRAKVKELFGDSTASISEEKLSDTMYLYRFNNDSHELQLFVFDGNDIIYGFLFGKNINSSKDDSTVDSIFRMVVDSVEFTGVLPSTSQITTEAPATEATTESQSSIYDDDVISYSTSKYAVSYVKHEFGSNYDGKNVLYYYYEFTNLSDEELIPISTLSMKAFQNGVSLETAISMDAPDEVQNSLKEVKNGGTLTVCSGFVLEDDSDISVESNVLFSNDQPDIQMIKVK